jgi:hypothetical protein
MKQTVNYHSFVEAFKSFNRENQFSYDGLMALFDHITQQEEISGEETELDVIALCCSYTEFKDLEEIRNEFSELEALTDEEALQWLEDHIAIEYDTGIILENF